MSDVHETLTTLFSRAAGHFAADRLEQADADYRAILARTPTHCDSLHGLGLLAMRRGRNEEAIDYLTRAVELGPAAVPFHNSLGNALRAQGRHAEAIKVYQAALARKPDMPELHYNLATALGDLGQAENAAAHFQEALHLRPGYVDAWNNYGNALRMLSRMEAAAEAYHAALRLNPDYLPSLINLGLATRELGQWVESEQSFRTAVRLAPHSMAAHIDLGLVLLLTGRYQEGWVEYAWRDRHTAPDAPQDIPRWAGEPLQGQTLLVDVDTVMEEALLLARYLPLVGQRTTVVVQAASELAPLLRALPGVQRVIGPEEGIGFDARCPLSLLPAALGTVLENVPPPHPLGIPLADGAPQSPSPSPSGGPRIGLAWAAGGSTDPRRAIPFDQFWALTRVPGLRFISLEQQPAGGRMPLADTSRFDDAGPDAPDLPTRIAGCDLVIGLDSRAVHLAASLGKPVWLLNRVDTAWYWLAEGPRTPWYPSVRQFRQTRIGDWSNVLSEVEAALWHYAGVRPPADPGRKAELAQPQLTVADLFVEATKHRQANRLMGAEQVVREALKLDPRHADSLHFLGTLSHESGQAEIGVTYLKRAVRRKPLPGFYNNLANALESTGQLEEALAAYEQCIRHAPNLAAPHINRASLLRIFGRYEEAYEGCETALRLQPDSPEGNYHLAMLNLLSGRFREGWEGFEWRHRLPKALARRIEGPLWEGESLRGRTLLVYADEGFGDTFQFWRLLPQVAKLGELVLEVPEQIWPLLSRHTEHPIVKFGETLPPFDLQCPILSLARILGINTDNVPNRPYLSAEPVRAAQWRDRLAAFQGFRVGVVWAGNPNFQADRRRSMSYGTISRLFDVKGATFVSLQKAVSDEPPRIGTSQSERLLDWTGELDSFEDTAALIDMLDLVISVDTGVVHLAGAMGKPVWLLNRFDTCWRWLREREDSPWYPTCRQFRQRQPGDWEDVIDRVRAALQRVVAGDLIQLQPPPWQPQETRIADIAGAR